MQILLINTVAVERQFYYGDNKQKDEYWLVMRR